MKKSLNNNCVYTVFCYLILFLLTLAYLIRKQETHFQNKVMVVLLIYAQIYCNSW